MATPRKGKMKKSQDPGRKKGSGGASKGPPRGRGRGPGKVGKAAVESAEKQRRVLELRKEGLTLQQIADELGYACPSGAHKALTRALEHMLREPVEEVRALECARLDAMWQKAWSRLKRGNVNAIDVLLRIMTRRSKLLGLDAPTYNKHEVTQMMNASSDEEIEDRVVAIYQSNSELWERVKTKVEGVTAQDDRLSEGDS
jgi:transcriptional regulator